MGHLLFLPERQITMLQEKPILWVLKEIIADLDTVSGDRLENVLLFQNIEESFESI
jgi:hypothetical protein